MGKALAYIFFALVAILSNFHVALGQNTDSTTVQEKVETEVKLYSIVLFNGNRFFGQIISETADQILLNDVKIGKVYIKREDIRNMNVKKATRYNGNSNQVLLSTIDYGFAPHSTVVPKGEVTVYSLYGVLNKVEFGLSKHVSMGFSNAALLGPSMINLKLCKRLDNNVHISGGVYLGMVPFSFDVFSYSYAGLTLGNAKNNLSVNYGYGTNSFADNSRMTVMAFSTQFAANWSLMGEAFLAENAFTQIGFLGCRYRTTRNLCWDFGLAAVDENFSLEENNLPIVFPFVAAKFGPR